MFKVTKRSGAVKIGPPDGPAVTIPNAFTIRVTEVEPYDLELHVRWDPQQGRHTLRTLTIEAIEDGDYVRMSKINQLKLREMVSTALARELLGEGGWQRIVAEHRDDNPVAVDALVYLLSHALGSQKPSATVAIARGLSPATGPKRVSVARLLGLLPPAEPGRATG
jgi:hypothetical protein